MFKLVGSFKTSDETLNMAINEFLKVK
jgi:hypothetical protein